VKLGRVSWFIVTLSTACTAPLLEEPDGWIDRAERDAASEAPPARAAERSSAPGSAADAGPTRAAFPTDASVPTSPTDASGPTPPMTPTPTNDAGRTVAIDEDAGEANEPVPVTTVNPPPTPIHRYDFSGSGARVMDVVGDAHGVLLGGAALVDGAVELDGIDDGVLLPAGLLSTRSSVTLLAWLRWDGGDCWQRVFDFGTRTTIVSSNGIEERVPSSLFLTLSRCPSNTPAVGYVDGEAKEYAAAVDPLPVPGMMQLGATFDGASQRLRLVLNGVVVAEQTSQLRLAELADLTAWLGRSQYGNDPPLAGQLTEFRIYDHALEPDVVADVFARGPDAL